MAPHVREEDKSTSRQPLEDRQQLLDFLLGGARPSADWGVGLETEKQVVDRQTGEAVDYLRIRGLLERLDGIGGWEGFREEGQLLGLRGKRSSVTLEPGGQLELSGKFCCDIHCSWRDLNRYRQHILTMGHELGLLFLGLGSQPFTPLEQIAWLPKPRYAIMGPYMSRTGDMGQRMMKQTAGTQVNLDFSDEADCMRKLRTAQLLSPVGYALFANSPLLDGKPSGHLSTRGEIWSRTDPDRCGLIGPLLAPDAGLDAYVDYALDVPLYFIQRNDAYVDLTQRRLTFREFFERGWQGERAILADWNLHLSTLFPEVRLRPQVEIRTADSLPPRYTAAVAAFYKGLLYRESGLTRVESLLGELSEEAFRDLYRASWTTGLKTQIGDANLGEIAAELVSAARKSLGQQFLDGDSGADEGVFLDVVDELLETGETLAEQLLQRWGGTRAERLQVLLDHCGYARG